MVHFLCPIEFPPILFAEYEQRENFTFLYLHDLSQLHYLFFLLHTSPSNPYSFATPMLIPHSLTEIHITEK